MLRQTQSGLLYHSAVSSDSHDLQVLLWVRGQLPGVMFSGRCYVRLCNCTVLGVEFLIQLDEATLALAFRLQYIPISFIIGLHFLSKSRIITMITCVHPCKGIASCNTCIILKQAIFPSYFIDAGY